MQLTCTIQKRQGSIYRIFFDDETKMFHLEILATKVLWSYDTIDQALADVENRELCLRIGYGS